MRLERCFRGLEDHHPGKPRRHVDPQIDPRPHNIATGLFDGFPNGLAIGVVVDHLLSGLEMLDKFTVDGCRGLRHVEDPQFRLVLAGQLRRDGDRCITDLDPVRCS